MQLCPLSPHPVHQQAPARLLQSSLCRPRFFSLPRRPCAELHSAACKSPRLAFRVVDIRRLVVPLSFLALRFLAAILTNFCEDGTGLGIGPALGSRLLCKLLDTSLLGQALSPASVRQLVGFCACYMPSNTQSLVSLLVSELLWLFSFSHASGYPLAFAF